MDDSPLNRAVLRRTLEAAGASVTEACDGLAAYEAYRSAGGARAFQLVLMDLVSPRADSAARRGACRGLRNARLRPPSPPGAADAPRGRSSRRRP